MVISKEKNEMMIFRRMVLIVQIVQKIYLMNVLVVVEIIEVCGSHKPGCKA